MVNGLSSRVRAVAVIEGQRSEKPARLAALGTSFYNALTQRQECEESERRHEAERGGHALPSASVSADWRI
jgi:hypothetical protein